MVDLLAATELNHDWQEDFQLICDRSNLLSIRQMIFFLGMVIGCLCTGQVSDKFGRKKTMLVTYM
jgi:MFS family permease